MSKRQRPPQSPPRTPQGQFVPGRSGNPAGRRRDARNSLRKDDWQNFFTGVGVFGKDKRVGTHFNLHQLSFDQLKDLWLGDDLAARAVETIPREALRQGYDIIISSSQDQGGTSAMDASELSAEVTSKLDVLGADDYLEVVGAYERGYGGGAILIGANDGQEDMTVPLNLQKVRSIDWITPLEARELMPLYAYSDPRAPKFGQPEIYQLTSRSVLPSYSGNYQSATMLIHESRLIPFPGIRVSRYQVTTARGGWGESVLNRLYRILRDFNQAWGSAGVLVTDFAQSVIKIAGLWEALALDGNQAFANRLAAMEYGRSVVNALTIDAGDEYSRQQTPLTGLPDLLEKFAVRLAAACDMPLTLLFGTSPAGMNATGESDVRFFYDRVASYQRRKMEPALRRLCQVIFRTIGNKQEPEKWNVKFRPLWQDSAKDKAGAMFTQAQADAAWIGAGVISAEEVAAAHWGQGEYNPNITIDFEAREAQEAAVAAPVDQEAINAMDPNHYSYVPPPEPGTAAPPGQVVPPGKPAAPDPNTRPVSTVQTEDHADADARAAVIAQLAEDYPENRLGWARSVSWSGPINVPLERVDSSNRKKWTAHRDSERVAKFMKKIQKGKVKPVILIDRPGKPKMMLADGHHRFLAHERLDRPVKAYVAKVDKVNGPWDEFHDSQRRNDADAPPVKTCAIGGIEIAIEDLAGTEREGIIGSVTVPCDYGYIPGVRGADGDSLDVMVGPNPDSQRVFVVQQMLPRSPGETWKYFQDKVLVGFDDEAAAKAAFLALHSGDARYEGATLEITLAELGEAVELARAGNGRMARQLSGGDARVDAARMDYIRKRGGKFYIYSEKTHEQLEGPFEGRAAAVKRLGQIEYFKHRGDAQERDEAGRYAGTGYDGPPTEAQSAARTGHERMAAEHAAHVGYHAGRARALHAAAEKHAQAGDWMKFGEASRKAIEHQGKAAEYMQKVSYHAARAGTDGARVHAVNATAELARRDTWSDEAREAAAEARKANAKGEDSKVSQRASAASKQADKRGSRYAHEKAAGEHRVAAAVAKKAGDKESAEAHAKAADAHQKAANEARTGVRVSRPAGPVAAAPDAQHGPVSPTHARAAEHEAAGGAKPAPKGGEGKGKGEPKEKGKKGESKVKSALEIGTAAAEIVGGKTAGAAAEGVAPKAGGGEGEKEKE